MSTNSSKTMGILRSQKGCSTIFPFRCWYLGSAGWTATAVSPSIVSIRVVATITSSSEEKNMVIKKKSTRCLGWNMSSCCGSDTWSVHLVSKRHQDPKLDFLLVAGNRQQSSAGELFFIHLKYKKVISSREDTVTRTDKVDLSVLSPITRWNFYQSTKSETFTFEQRKKSRQKFFLLTLYGDKNGFKTGWYNNQRFYKSEQEYKKWLFNQFLNSLKDQTYQVMQDDIFTKCFLYWHFLRQKLWQSC